jgi:hypothetical protein
VALFAVLAGCGTARVTTAKGPDGTYRLKCSVPLPACLNEANVCPNNSYTVMRAVDQYQHLGTFDHYVEIRGSDAIVRCGRPGARPPQLDEVGPQGAPASTAPASAPPAPAPPPPAPTCVPGASQACVGPAGCAGGQVCAASGAGFGPCDCGPGAVARPPVPQP